MKNNVSKYDVIVVGAGHAGIEAAMICAKKKFKVALFVLSEKLIANMPCNPSIGGPAKGIVTREIDALGGVQGIAADATKLQIKMLNTSKGAGTWALRAQIDKVEYHNYFLELIKANKSIDIIIGEVEEIITNNENEAIGVVCNQKQILAKKIIITTGTFLDSQTHQGLVTKKEGPDGFSNSTKLVQSLHKLGLKTIRLKTGTPPRIDKDSIDYSQLSLDLGSDDNLAFSHINPIYLPLEKQLPCYIVHTNNKTHKIIFANLDKSPMYNGKITGVGPRYCPSIEDKVVRFSDKERHQIFVEPESIHLSTVYLAGFSSSLPKEVQDKLIKTLPGFEKAIIIKYAYAIEYDAISSLQLKHTLETKSIKNLFFAGQINGTSGYEEAAGQGLIAGINAICQLENRPEFILHRNESYIGVLIDDLVTKEVTEPYRLLTSRAEYRLELRNDNADERLLEKGYNLGLISKKDFLKFKDNLQKIELIISYLKKTYAASIKNIPIKFRKSNITLYDLLKNPEYSYKNIEPFLNIKIEIDDFWKEKIDIRIKYEGYILSQKKVLNEKNNLIKVDLKSISNYNLIPNISLEAMEKLNKVMPINLDQASRISGINFSDLINIKMFVEKNKVRSQ